MFELNIEIHLDDMLPKGKARWVTACFYVAWAIISIGFVASGFFQQSPFLRAAYIATGSLFFLALLSFIAINILTAGKPGCILLVVQNGIAAVLGILALLTFFLGASLEMFLK